MGRDTARRALGIAAMAALAGCVAYRPESLPEKPDLKPSVAGLALPAARFQPLPGLAPRRIALDAPLDATDVAILAVLNDPGLRATHAKRGVAAAQLFAAGLLPDPELGLAAARPAGDSGATNTGFDIGLTEALVPLVTRADRVRAARAHLHEVDLGLLWQGWQVAQRARWLTAEIVADRKLQVTEQAVWNVARGWRQRLHLAMGAGVASTKEIAAADLLLSEIVADISATGRELNDAERRLHELLGLTPTAKLHLCASSTRAISATAVANSLKHLPERRPDLLALAAGFKGADETLRAAIAAQFPAISVSFLRKRDVEGATSLGIGLNLRLPFFNGNRGAIREAEASRAALRAIYQARLDEAVSEVSRLERDGDLLTDEVARLKAARLRLGAYRNRLQGFASSGIASGSETLGLAMQFYRIRRREITAELALRKNRIALETLLGVPPGRLSRPMATQRS